MKYKHTYTTYKTGSVKGVVINDVETYTPTKVTYIKIKRGNLVYYLGENGELTDEKHAKCFFNSQQANELVAKMRANPRYQNYDVRPFETSYIPHQEVKTREEELHDVETDIAPQIPTRPIIEKPAIENHIKEPSVAEQRPSAAEQQPSSEPDARRPTEPRSEYNKTWPIHDKQYGSGSRIFIGILAVFAGLAIILTIVFS